MAEFPKLPLWTDAYLGDTTHLTTIEHGAYLLLLIAMWRSKGTRLPNDDKLLARYARLTAGQWARIRPVIMPFFKVDGDGITQSRLTDEANAVRQHSAMQSDKAKARHRKDKDKPPAAGQPNACRNDASQSQSHTEKPKGSSVEGARKRAAVKMPIPHDAVLDAESWRMAEAKGLSREEAEAQFERFRDSAVAAGRRYADWGAAWRNWLTSDFFRPITSTSQRRKYHDGSGLDDHFDAFKARLAVQRLE